MKKIIVGLAVVASVASADFLSFSVGAGVWQEDISGYVKTDGNINYFSHEDNNPATGDLKLDNNAKPYVWAKLIHPVPMLPNIKLQYTQYHTRGKDGYVVGDVKFFGQSVTAADIVDTDITIDSYDITAFYQLDFLFDAEAGVGVNVLNGTTKMKGITVDSYTNWTVPIPYLYAKVGTPTIFGFSLDLQGKYLNIGDAYYHDYQGAVKYHLPFPIVDMTFSVGYKTQEIYGKDNDSTTDMKFKGAYAEVGAKW